MNKYDLPNILYYSLDELGGQASIVEVCRYVWDNYEKELKNAGSLFYTWQYDIRWAATKLRKEKRMKAVEDSPAGLWEIAR